MAHVEDMDLVVDAHRRVIESTVDADIADALNTLGSPIEATFFYALWAICIERRLSFDVRFNEADVWCIVCEGEKSTRFRVTPQWPFGRKKIDFHLDYQKLSGFDKDSPVYDESKVLLIECDGHDFHEKTKKQASSDKRRDRMLQTEGHTIFRYSGSDIYNEPLKCADECLTYLMGTPF